MFYKDSIIIEKNRSELWRIFLDKDYTEFWQPFKSESKNLHGEEGKEGYIVMNTYKSNQQQTQVREKIQSINDYNATVISQYNGATVKTNHEFEVVDKNRTLYRITKNIQYDSWIKNILNIYLIDQYKKETRKVLTSFKFLCENI